MKGASPQSVTGRRAETIVGKKVFEEIDVFYRGLVLGLMIAAPVGPIGLLCIRRTLKCGFLKGFATGLGAACADTLFGAVAALGVTAILDFMRHYDMFIRIVGGLALVFGAWHAWRDKPQAPKMPKTPAQLLEKVIHPVRHPVRHLSRSHAWLDALKSLLTGFAITITNPVVLFAVLAVVASFSHVQTHLEAVTVIVGIFSGSVLWWFLLSGGVMLVRGSFTEERILIVNRVTAVALAGIAAFAIFTGGKLILRHYGVI